VAELSSDLLSHSILEDALHFNSYSFSGGLIGGTWCYVRSLWDRFLLFIVCGWALGSRLKAALPFCLSIVTFLFVKVSALYTYLYVPTRGGSFFSFLWHTDAILYIVSFSSLA